MVDLKTDFILGGNSENALIWIDEFATNDTATFSRNGFKKVNWGIYKNLYGNKNPEEEYILTSNPIISS